MYSENRLRASRHARLVSAFRAHICIDAYGMSWQIIVMVQVSIKWTGVDYMDTRPLYERMLDWMPRLIWLVVFF